MTVRIQTGPFDAQAEADALREGDLEVGAVVTFVGTVRDVNDGDSVATLELEHYPGMTEKAIAAIVDEARTRWALADTLVIHRYGPLRPGEAIMMVATAARHRKAAFEAAEYLMDYLKSRAPFWKKEERAGDADWVEARQSDDAAAARWSGRKPEAAE